MLQPMNLKNKQVSERSHKGPVLYDSIYMKYPEWQIYRDESRIMVGRGWGLGGTE